MQTLGTLKELKSIIKPHFSDEKTEVLGLSIFPRVTQLENVGAQIHIQAADFKAYAIKLDIKFYPSMCKCFSIWKKVNFSENILFHQKSPRPTQ